MVTNVVERLWVDGPWRTVFLAREISFFRRLCEVPPAARILEIGCGRGAGARLILRSFQPERVDAIDLDPGMVKRAKRWTSRRLAPRLCFQVADAQALPFADGSMDVVVNFGIIHHLEDWKLGIREVARVLRPGGLFLFEEIYPALYAGFILRSVLVHPRENRFDGPQYRAAIEAAGLRLVEGFRETKYTILGAAVRA